MRPAHGFEGACAPAQVRRGARWPAAPTAQSSASLSDAAPGAPLPRFSTFDREALRAAAENGWARGLAVPVARGGTRFGLVTLIGRGEEFDQAQRAYLSLISECLLTRIRSLGVDYALPPAGMSKREIEAVRLVALGSDEEIAAKLGISPSTVHKHVESARMRVNAKNRASLAALSVSLGIATAA